jgi:indole-3-glycerol phosphate synthase
MNILETIIAKKKMEVAESKRNKSVRELESAPFFNHEVLSFSDYLLREDKTGIIAEFKRKSPSKGIINDHATVKEVTAGYAHFGASGISVLTDEEFFGGSLQYQLLESKAFGAGVILLIAACLTRDEVAAFAAFAKNIGLNVLLEIHNEQELHHICNDVDVIGVNNRDLKTFTTDINRSIELSSKIPADKIKISESGIDNIDSIKLLRQHGFKGFLIGEKFMKEKDPIKAFENFTIELNMNT